MPKLTLVTLAAFSSAALVAASSAHAQSSVPADEATKFITTVIDKFNGGDVKGWISAQEDNSLIVDEFAPHLWVGPGSPQRWLDAYAKDAKTKGVSGGRVDYGKPLEATSDGRVAYIVLPTTYRFMQKGMKMAEPGSMTFVLKREAQAWKIASWTYSSGGEAAPEK